MSRSIGWILVPTWAPGPPSTFPTPGGRRSGLSWPGSWVELQSPPSHRSPSPQRGGQTPLTHSPPLLPVGSLTGLGASPLAGACVWANACWGLFAAHSQKLLSRYRGQRFCQLLTVYPNFAFQNQGNNHRQDGGPTAHRESALSGHTPSIT